MSKKAKPLRAKTTKVVLKTVLGTPFKYNWEINEKSDEILTKVKKELKECEVKKFPGYKNWKSEGFKTRAEKLDNYRKNLTSDQKNLLSQLACGINEVTKALEKNDLSVLLVEKSVPQIMIRHLIPLSALKHCPTVCVSGMKNYLTNQLGVTSLVAFGIKKKKEGDCDKFQGIRDIIQSYALPINLENIGLQLNETQEKSKQVKKLKRKKQAPNNELSLKKEKIDEKVQTADFGSDFISFGTVKSENSWKEKLEGPKTIRADNLYKTLNIQKIPRNQNRKSGKKNKDIL
ncbi:DgyrCDS7146 [Dimorphilus gyrociliatus]|uniref:DgyrCDS7146 n=1 Tax=Dimorphilus gyrociliatus TaxID=2664684 RepID=A0A7I8VRU8_9ANNE|nr:DgyrCDS7146 [Dimorphilus gyrociliatus]